MSVDKDRTPEIRSVQSTWEKPQPKKTTTTTYSPHVKVEITVDLTKKKGISNT